nr:FliA/WhiG family RNA polymerase sigma factor [Sphingomonas sp. Y38-1Y]
MTPFTYARTTPPAVRDVEAQVRAELPMVRRVAWHVHGSMSSIVEVEDLVQIGMIALVEAARSFEDRGETSFRNFAMTRVRGAMIDELRRQATLTRGAMKRRRRYQDTLAALTHALGRAPREEEVAERLGVTIEKLRLDYATAEAVRFDSIDEVYSDELSWFADDEADAFTALAEMGTRDALARAIADLPEREALVIQLYYVEELNLEEIGQVVGVGAARICQIKASAHARLKKALKGRV